MNTLLLIPAFIAYVIFIALVFYICCKAANELESDD